MSSETIENWEQYACNTLKAELARSGISYGELAARLETIGVQESYKGIAAKINRGTFSFAFFAQCCRALGIKTVRLNE
jgi:hypothetical protein